VLADFGDVEIMKKIHTRDREIVADRFPSAPLPRGPAADVSRKNGVNLPPVSALYYNYYVIHYFVLWDRIFRVTEPMKNPATDSKIMCLLNTPRPAQRCASEVFSVFYYYLFILSPFFSLHWKIPATIFASAKRRRHKKYIEIK